MIADKIIIAFPVTFAHAGTILITILFLAFAQNAKADGAIISNGGPADIERLIALTLTQACSGARGEINWNDVVRADVNEDGLEDIVIDHIKIKCFGDTGGTSALCGVSGNCNVTIYLKDKYGWRIN